MTEGAVGASSSSVVEVSSLGPSSGGVDGVAALATLAATSSATPWAGVFGVSPVGPAAAREVGPRRAAEAAAAGHTSPGLSEQQGCSAVLQLLSPRCVSSCTPAKSLPLGGQHSPGTAALADSAGAGSLNGSAFDCGCGVHHQNLQRLQFLERSYPPSAAYGDISGSWCGSDFSAETTPQRTPGALAWGLVEHQQQQLECLQQAINYCEERCSMGRALRSREAAVRAHLLQSQLQQQNQQQQRRQQRNSRLMEEAVAWALQKTLAPQPKAEQRLSRCLAVLHTQMQKRLPPDTFALAATTPGIGGTSIFATASPSSLTPRGEQHQTRRLKAARPAATEPAWANRRPANPGQKRASRGSDPSSSPTAVLYEGAADAAASRELVQTRAALLLHQQQGSNASNMQGLLSLEGDVRAHVAMLATAAAPASPSRPAAAAEGCAMKGEDCYGSPSIPEESSEIYRQTVVLPSPQRLIATSESRCIGDQPCRTSRAPKAESFPARDTNNSNATQGTFGEQQWLNLARQVSVLQDMLLQNQQQRCKQQRRRGSRNQQESSEQSAGPRCFTADKAPVRCRASGYSGQLLEDSSAAATAAGKLASTTGEIGERAATCASEGQPGPTTMTSAKSYSAAEALLRKQRQRQQQQVNLEQHLQQQHELPLKKQLGKSTDGLASCDRREGVSDEPSQDGTAAASAASSSSSCCLGGKSGSIHQVRSRSGTPVMRLAPSRQESACGKQSALTSAAPAIAREAKPTIHRLPPMAKAAPLGMKMGPYNGRPPTAFLRPCPPSFTPRALPKAPANAPIAPQQTSPQAAIPANENKRQGQQLQHQKTTANSSTLEGASSIAGTRGHAESLEKSQIPSIGALPPPAEVAELLLGL